MFSRNAGTLAQSDVCLFNSSTRALLDPRVVWTHKGLYALTRDLVKRRDRVGGELSHFEE